METQPRTLHTQHAGSRERLWYDGGPTASATLAPALCALYAGRECPVSTVREQEETRTAVWCDAWGILAPAPDTPPE